MTKFRTGTVLRFAEGNIRIDRVHQRPSGNTYDIVRLSDGKRSPDYLEGMLHEGIRQGARFNRGDGAQWRNKPCRILDRTWSVSAQEVQYSIELDGRSGRIDHVKEHDLSVA